MPTAESPFAVECPSCSKTVPFQCSTSRLVICPFCRVGLRQDDQNQFESVGRVPDLLADSSPFRPGTNGVYKNSAFSLLGRIQMWSDDGHWSEWYLLFNDGRVGWLGEASGKTMMTFEMESARVPSAVEDLEPGVSLEWQGNTYEVVAVDEAVYGSLEGELPFDVALGDPVVLVDLKGRDGRFITFDCGETPALAYSGEYVTTDQLGLTHARR